MRDWKADGFLGFLSHLHHKIMFLQIHVSMCFHVSTYICQSVSPNPDLSSRRWLRTRDQSCSLGYRGGCVYRVFVGFFILKRTSIQDPLRTTCWYHTLLSLYTHSCARAARQLGQQLTRAAASPSCVSALRKQPLNISSEDSSDIALILVYIPFID